jgi:hypothetical protein
VLPDEVSWSWFLHRWFGPADSRSVDVAIPAIVAGLEASARPIDGQFVLDVDITTRRCAVIDLLYFQALFGWSDGARLARGIALDGIELKLDRGVLGIEEVSVCRLGRGWNARVTLRRPMWERELFRPSFGDEVYEHVRQEVFG